MASESACWSNWSKRLKGFKRNSLKSIFKQKKFKNFPFHPVTRQQLARLRVVSSNSEIRRTCNFALGAETSPKLLK